MRRVKTLGIVGGIAVLLLSAGTVVAAPAGGAPARENQGRALRPFAASTTIAAMREEDRARVMAIASSSRNSITQVLQNVRSEVQAKVAARREEVQNRLSELQDRMKQQEAQRLATQFVDINTRWTNRFTQTLDRYDAILQKVQDRANIAQTQGKNISATTAAIANAKSAIDTARIAVVAQAAVVYTLATSTVAASPTVATSTPEGQGELIKALRNSFNDLHQSLFKDLFALRDGPMTNARKAVQAAIQTLAKIPGVDEGAATSTPSTATTTTP